MHHTHHKGEKQMKRKDLEDAGLWPEMSCLKSNNGRKFEIISGENEDQEVLLIGKISEICETEEGIAVTTNTPGCYAIFLTQRFEKGKRWRVHFNNKAIGFGEKIEIRQT